jgi:hypothetical protein
MLRRSQCLRENLHVITSEARVNSNTDGGAQRSQDLQWSVARRGRT